MEPEKIKLTLRRSLDANLSEHSSEQIGRHLEKGHVIEAVRKIEAETGIAAGHVFSVVMGMMERPSPDPHAAQSFLKSWTEEEDEVEWLISGMGRIISSPSFHVFVRETCKMATSARDALDLDELNEDDFVAIIEGASDQRIYGAITATLCKIRFNGQSGGIGLSSEDIIETLDRAWRARDVDSWISEITGLSPYEMVRMTTVVAAALLGLTISSRSSGRSGISSSDRGEPISFEGPLPIIECRFPENDFTTNHSSLWRKTDRGVPLAVASSRGGGMSARFWVRQIIHCKDPDLGIFPDLEVTETRSQDTVRNEIWAIGVGAHCDSVTPVFAARIVRDASYAEMHMVHMKATEHCCLQDPIVQEAQETLGMLMGEQIYDDMILRAHVERENMSAVPVNEDGDVVYAEGFACHAFGVVAALAGPVEGTHLQIGWHDGQRHRYDCQPEGRGSPPEIHIVDMELQQDPWGALLIVNNEVRAVRRLEKPTDSDRAHYHEAIEAIVSEIPQDAGLSTDDIERYAAVTYAVHPDTHYLGAVAAWLENQSHNVAVIHVVGDLMDIHSDQCRPWEGVPAAATRLLEKDEHDASWFEKVCNAIEPGWRD